MSPVNVSTAQSNLYLELITWTCLGIRGSGEARHGWCSEDNGAKFQTEAEDPDLKESKRRNYRRRLEADYTFAAL